MKNPLLLVLLIAFLAFSALAQDPYPGLTIISPRASTETYLIDLDDNVVKTWHGADVPTEFAYLLPDDSILRPCRVPEAEGRGGRIQRIDTNDVVVWDYYFFDTDYLQHHDIQPMPSGNVLVVAWERHSMAEGIQAGRQVIDGDVKSTYLAEIEPVGATGGNVVWEWRAWDHLVQEADSTKDNFGVVADHPELIDVNFGDVSSGTWLHVNAIDYNEDLDQIVFCSRATSELYVVDHGTTTAEAAGHTGGSRGRGGDIVYRWGNPQVYGRGDTSDQILWSSHGVLWIDEGLPGAGNLMIFNNGDHPSSADDMSSVEEILPPQTSPGEYLLEADQAFGPASAVWRYGDRPAFFSRFFGGAYRMPNGNTLICEGMEGIIFEVNPDGTTVWLYLAGEAVHRAPRYWDPDVAPVETPTAAFRLDNHPNPFNPSTTIRYALPARAHLRIKVYDVAGRELAVLVDAVQDEGIQSVKWNGMDKRGLPVGSGVYFARLETEHGNRLIKMTLMK